MTELRRTCPAYFASKNKIALTPAIDTDKVLREIAARYAGERVDTTDGVKIDFPENCGCTCASRIPSRSSASTPRRARWKEADALARRFMDEIGAICGL